MHTTYSVAVVGAGFAGIGMAVALARDGIDDFVVLEKAQTLGGVWRDNTYPGCVCDVPAHLYSYSFAPYRDTIRRYPDQPDTLAYLHHVVGTHDLARHLRFGIEISDARYDEHTATWRLRTEHGETITAATVIFAVGMLHRPALPTIPGLDTFPGPVMHTARWDHSIDLAGRTVAVIGTGASAVQLIPHLADTAARVTVYQRTPTWVLPIPGRDFSEPTRWALEHLPDAHRIYRATVATLARTVLWPVMVRGWSARPIETLARIHLRRQIGDPVLRDALTPTHPIGTKRILLSNTYFPALTRDTVELVTDAITEVTETAIHTESDAIRRAEVIVCATGFHATDFLAPIRIQGRGHRVLHEQWAQTPEALLGSAVPGFPNMFILAGPGTFSAAGSNIAVKESQIAMIRAAMRWREHIGAPAIEAGPAAMADYRHRFRRAIAATVWPDNGPSWYRTPSGEVVAPWPDTPAAFDRATRRHPATMFVPTPAPTGEPGERADSTSDATGADRTRPAPSGPLP